jgi:adenosylhomocysteine nucleosidase
MIVVTFAVPHESRGLRSALRHASRAGTGDWLLGNLGLEEVLVVHTGIGLAAAEANTRAVLAEFRPNWLLCAGYAGALESHLVHGQVVVARNFSAPELRARCHCQRVVLTTESHAVETVPAKAALARKTGAQVVDMETSAVARVCGEHGVPLLAVRVISDTAGQRIPVPLEISFDLERQRPKIRPLLACLAYNPTLIVPFILFVTGLARARAALTDALIDAILAAPHPGAPASGSASARDEAAPTRMPALRSLAFS